MSEKGEKINDDNSRIFINILKNSQIPKKEEINLRIIRNGKKKSPFYGLQLAWWVKQHLKKKLCEGSIKEKGLLWEI